ncbi:MAG: hypothetical protein ABH877_04330 [bacterium]
MSAMQRYLDELIKAGDDAGAEVQIVFNPGAGQMAGGLRHARHPATGKDLSDLYELCTAAKPGPDAPLEIRKLDFVVISQVFSAEAVQRVIKQIGGPEKSVIVQQ